MIHEVDESLRSLIKRDALTGTDVDVVFDAPTKEWSSRRNAPTVDVYLYDIREDLRRREVGRFDARDSDGRVVDRRQPPRWYKLSYLVTAWTQRPEDEHRLLAAMLQCFLHSDHLPDNLLVGSLSDSGYPVPYTCALPPPEDRALSDVWSALGGELKPSLDLVIVAPFDLERPVEIGPPVLEGPQLAVTTGRPSRRRGRGKQDGKPGAADAAAEPGGGPAPREVRTGARTGHPGRRLVITELPT